MTDLRCNDCDMPNGCPEFCWCGPIDTADHVRHGPTGEEWVVACVQGDRLSWCGWPEGMAALSDCKLTKKASPEEREKLLRDLAESGGSDHRARYAQHRLSADHPQES